MEDILGDIKKTYCNQCESGSAGEELGYFSPGSSLDYAYEKLGVAGIQWETQGCGGSEEGK